MGSSVRLPTCIRARCYHSRRYSSNNFFVCFFLVTLFPPCQFFGCFIRCLVFAFVNTSAQDQSLLLSQVGLTFAGFILISLRLFYCFCHCLSLAISMHCGSFTLNTVCFLFNLLIPILPTLAIFAANISSILFKMTSVMVGHDVHFVPHEHLVTFQA